MAVEASRLGAVFASNVKAYRSWRRTSKPRRVAKQALSDRQTELAIMQVAQMFPANVEIVRA